MSSLLLLTTELFVVGCRWQGRRETRRWTRSTPSSATTRRCSRSRPMRRRANRPPLPPRRPCAGCCSRWRCRLVWPTFDRPLLLQRSAMPAETVVSSGLSGPEMAGLGCVCLCCGRSVRRTCARRPTPAPSTPRRDTPWTTARESCWTTPSRRTLHAPLHVTSCQCSFGWSLADVLSRSRPVTPSLSLGCCVFCAGRTLRTRRRAGRWTSGRCCCRCRSPSR